eukprot:TRINITY_DN10326_c0_g1_i1.p1 TRINITY_DN10326_c0_g1~~TRINITY_DN10326_c0_g1_i1.p1  ORF type:complete len:414 (-),score=74.19 TRINITY_DN10326_c0_g1_i1:13-1254(-)
MEEVDALYANTLPEYNEGHLEEGAYMSTCCQFNSFGSLFACGCHDGRIVIWDFDTRRVGQVLVGHSRPISSLCWSNDGLYLISSSLDWTVKVWDIATLDIVMRYTFDSMVLNIDLHPSGEVFIAECWMEQPVVVRVRDGLRFVVPGAVNNDCNVNPQSNSIARFNYEGDKIYVGNYQGEVSIYKFSIGDTLSFEEIDSFTVNEKDTPAIKGMAFSRDGLQFLVNCTDRFIRVYNCDDNFNVYSLHEPVDRRHWNVAKFGRDDFIYSGSGEKAEHKIYIWNRHDGQLFKILEGPTENILDITWHPRHPIIASCSTYGYIYIWKKQLPENWSAFAPNFTELEENEEYIEKETEFDVLVIEDEKKPEQMDTMEDEIDLWHPIPQKEPFIPVTPIPEKYYKIELLPHEKKLRGRKKK